MKSVKIFLLKAIGFTFSALLICLCLAQYSQAYVDIVTLTHDDPEDVFYSVTLGNGYAFWSDYDRGIYMWNTNDSVAKQEKISDDESVTVLSAYGDKCAWVDDSDDIQLWNGSSESEVEDDVIWTISLYGDNIAFVEEDSEDFWNPDTEIFLRTPDQKIQISDNDYYDKQPSVYMRTVAWVGEHDDNFDLFYWDGNTEVKLTDTDGDDLHPSLWNGKIAWMEWDGDDWEIYYWAGGENIQITDNDEDDLAPVLRDGKIVWIQRDGSCYDLYMWDGSTTKQLTNKCYSIITSMDFNGDAILWTGIDDSERGVYYATISGSSSMQTKGWWYNADEPGTGLATEIKNNKMSLVWFVFDGLGRTTWYTAGGDMDTPDSFSGDLYKWTGWEWGDEYSLPVSTVVGQIVVDFSDSEEDSVTFTVNINNIVITNTFTAFMADFSPGEEDSRHLTGWWYDPSYEGMGFFMDARGDNMALAWYNYREDHTARWWTSNNVFPDGTEMYIGNLNAWTGGPCATCPYENPPTEIPGAGGSISITFTDADHAEAQIGNTYLHLERFELH